MSIISIYYFNTDEVNWELMKYLRWSRKRFKPGSGELQKPPD
jgi:hypothetical protein